MVADDHGVVADAVHHLGLGLARVGGEEQRPLELVAGVEHQHVLAGRLTVAQAVDRGEEPRRAAEALARRLVLGRAGRVEGVDRLDSAVEVVDVQDVQRERLGAARPSASAAATTSGRGTWADLVMGAGGVSRASMTRMRRPAQPRGQGSESKLRGP